MSVHLTESRLRQIIIEEMMNQNSARRSGRLTESSRRAQIMLDKITVMTETLSTDELQFIVDGLQGLIADFKAGYR